MSSPEDIYQATIALYYVRNAINVLLEGPEHDLVVVSLHRRPVGTTLL